MMVAIITTGSIAVALLSIVALVKVVIPAGRAIHTAFKEFVVALHIFNGRPGFTDDVTGEDVDEVPPLGKVLASMRNDLNEQGRSISDLTSVLATVADQQSQIAEIHARLEAHDSTIGALIAGTYERGAEKVLLAAEKVQEKVVDVESEETT